MNDVDQQPMSEPERSSALNWLAVLAVIGVLLAICWPAMNAAQISSHRRTCENNLKYLALGMAMYADTYSGRLPYGTCQQDGMLPEQRLSWIVETRGYVLDGQIQYLFDYSQPWNADHNLNLQVKSMQFNPDRWVTRPVDDMTSLMCPRQSMRRTGNISFTSYVGVTGIGEDSPTLPLDDPRGGIWRYDRQVNRTDIKDGLANTLLFCETNQNNGPWTAGGHATLRALLPDKVPFIGSTAQFGANHDSVCATAWADGSTRLVSEAVDSKVFRAGFTIAAGD